MQRVHRMQRSWSSTMCGPRSTTFGLVDLRPSSRASLASQSKYMLLQRALAGLVADRAVDRVVDERELEHLLARDVDARVGVWHDLCLSATGV